MIVLGQALAILVVVVAATGPDVRGNVVCPSAEDVAARLGPMLASDAGFPPGAFVDLADVAASTPGLVDVEIRLRTSAAGAPLAVRRVERGGGCADTADAAAVIAASWASRYATSAPPPLADSALPEAPGVAVRAPDPAKPGPLASARPQFSIGAVAGIVAATAGGSAALVGGEVDVRRGRWVARLALAGMAERTIAVDPGSAGWRRLMVLPSLGMVWGSPRAFAELGVGAAIGVTETRGLGFGTNATDMGIDVGGVPSFRLGARLAALPATVWIGGAALIWFRPHGVGLVGGGASKTLPRLDGFLGGGVSFLFDS